MMKSLPIILVFAAFTTTASAQTAGETLKNVQVLKDVPMTQWDDTMELIGGSIGVNCQYCHERALEGDGKKPKQVAREMMRMTREINNAHYEGKPVVTCNTCHQGSKQPQAMASVWSRTGTGRETPPAGATPQSNIAEVLAGHLKASGAHEVKSMRVTGTFEATAAPIPPVPFEIDFVYPNRYRAHFVRAGGEFFQIIDGDHGWLGSSTSLNDMKPANLARSKESLGNFRPVKTIPQDTVRATADPATGLLQSLRTERPTPFGPVPLELLFDDYRDVGGIKMPYRISTLALDGRGTFTISKIEFDVPIDPAVFEKPAPPSPPK
jgi:outer membrane lipoprotein-sorting protein